MAMIRSLPEDYSHFVSSLMLSDKLDKSIITQAFHTEEIQRTRRSAPQISEVANKVTAVITTPIPSNTNSTCNSACTHNQNHNMLSALNPTYITSPYLYSHTSTYLYTSIVSPCKGYIHGLLY